jgi:hypothetical protein
VFIQDDIDGVSGTTVARHIKTLLREQSPRMVLLTGNDASRAVAGSWFDDIMLLSGSEQSISDAFKRHLDATDGLIWRGDISGDGVSGEDSPISEEFPGVLDNSEQIAPEPFPTEFPPVPDLEMSQPPVEIPPPDPEVSQPSTVVTPADPEKKRAALNEAREKLLSPGTLITAPGRVQETPPAQVSPPRYRPVAPPSVPVSEEPVWDDLVPRGEPVNGRSLQGSLLWIYGAGFVVAVAIALFFYSRSLVRHTPVVSTASPDTQQPATNSSPAGMKLPSFVTSGSIDREYGAAHPGWERYVSITGSMEYLVFREGGAIKALQMIALKEAVIDEPFMRTALRELLGSDTYRVTGSSVKNGFVVESGTAAGRAELLVYRKDRSSVPVAVVVTVP